MQKKNMQADAQNFQVPSWQMNRTLFDLLIDENKQTFQILCSQEEAKGKIFQIAYNWSSLIYQEFLFAETNPASQIRQHPTFWFYSN